MASIQDRTLGQWLSERLVQMGVETFFAVPGDYNLMLLDEIASNKDISACYTCNELNAGYAADGYARVRGVGAVVSTFTVGGLSLINAIAGSFAENQTVICITGAPNSNDRATNHILHHTIGKKGDFDQELRCFKEVTCEAVVISNLEDAVELIDMALSSALLNHKPVYISICCNLANLTHPSFHTPTKYRISPKTSNPESLSSAVKAASEFLNSKTKPVLVAGPWLKPSRAQDAFIKLVNASGFPFAVMPAAKGLVDETHPQFLGSYWGAVSTPLVQELVESADGYLFAGPVWNDYATVGYTLHLQDAKMVCVYDYRVSVQQKQVFGCVRMDDFLNGLADAIKHNPTAMENFNRMVVPTTQLTPSQPGSPLQVKHLFNRLQDMLSEDIILMADTGDSLFNCQKLKLPPGCRYEWSQQYGSIGWSVGAALGASVAVIQGDKTKRVLACIGDGSFQVTAQDLSTMIRYNLNPIIILINNGGYTIEAEIHDGSYNKINNWDYVGVAKAFENGQGGLFATRVTTEDELVEALQCCRGEAANDFLCFIEVVVHKDDCSRELLEWGALVSASNSRPPVEH